MIAAMSRAGYPSSFSASVVGAAAATDILIPPSVAFIIYSVLVPGASVPALFAAGMIPGILAGVALIVPAVWMSRRHRMGALESSMPRPPFWDGIQVAQRDGAVDHHAHERSIRWPRPSWNRAWASTA